MARNPWPVHRRLPVALTLVLALFLVFGGTARATNLPPGFVDTVVVSNPFPENFAQFDWSPDGILFIGDKPGKVYAWIDSGDPAGTFELRLIAQLLVNSEGERGLNGLAVDPDYLTNHHVWIYYGTRVPNHNVVSRFTFDGVALVDETIMIEGPVVNQTDHNSGCLRFASDKTLFISMGDDFQGAATAQNPFDLRGKILHINRDGSPAADNPYLDGVNGDPRVWAMGLRNPYRISVQPGTDNVFIGDVGLAAWEELDVGFPGANFGWPFAEGPIPAGLPYDYPIYSYSHDGEGAAIIGGDFVGQGDFAPAYDGDYFFAEFVQKELYRVILDDANNVAEVELFATDFGFVTDMRFGPDGALYYVCRSCGPASVRKISYVGGDNSQPVAVASAKPTGGLAPLDVAFDGSASFDGDDDPLTFLWDFGDGAGSPMMSPNHSFAHGVYETRLTVTDDFEGIDISAPIRIVSGNSPPVAEVTSPLPATRYNGGQMFTYSGIAGDLEDTGVPCSAFTWQVVFHHNVHTHPFLGPIQGACEGSFVTPLVGERAPDQWFEIRLTVQDTGTPIGNTGKLDGFDSFELLPNLAEMTFQSLPLADLSLSLDTVPFTPPMSVVGVTGMLRDIGVPDIQLGSNGRWYRWLSWSDGGTAQHTLSTPAVDTTLTASFACVPEELTTFHVEPDGDELVFTWNQGSPHCFSAGHDRYKIYAAPTAQPNIGDGAFPLDPAYRLVGSSANRGYRYVPEPDDVYFLVIGTNPQDQSGLLGHYGE